MFRNAFRAVAVVLVTGVFAPSMPASAGMDPASFINNLGNQLQAVTRSASTQQRLAGFEELFHASFDIPGLGRFVLGRFWRAFTPFEQQEFLSLFERYVVLTYSEKLSDYTGEGRDDGRGCVHAEPPAMGAVAREGRQATRDAVSPQPRRISDRLSRLRDDPKGPLFRTIGRGTSKLTRTVLPQANAYAMIGRRAAAAGIATRLGNHSFRATGITAYLKNGGTLEKAAAMANHASTRTTQLYDRRRDEGSASMRSSAS